MINRIYNDYFLKDRMSDYESLLKKFACNDYKFLMIKDAYKKRDNKFKYIFIRHDIDSDLKIARKMFEVEKKLNIKSTFYFRLSTLDEKLISDILEYGSEVGYHYEEISTYCKKSKKATKNYVKNNISKIQDMFIHNLKSIENNFNFKMASIASHGDFINRKIKISNDYLYTSKLKNKLGLIEAYDIEDMLDFRTSDCMYPKFFKEDPNNAINENKTCVLLLVHTRYWGKNPIERLKLDLRRVIDNMLYKFCFNKKGD